MQLPRPSLCIMTTAAISVRSFYGGQIEALNKAGFKTTVVCADAETLAAKIPPETDVVSVNFSRIVNPLKDIVALWQVFGLFLKRRFDIVQYSTPKAALIGSIAAFLARIPFRIYILWGLYYTGTKGPARFILKCFERIICLLSTNIIPISHEMVEFALNEGFGQKEKYEVMLNGSACGIDLELFDPGKWEPFRNQIRNQYNIPENSIVVGTVARLTGDKGINELVQAFDKLSNEIPPTYLLLVGEEEEKNRLDADTVLIIRRNNHIRCAGWQANPLPYYAAMDIFCLPTYREGFGEVNLEAQAMKLPVVSTDVIGPRESVANGRTGFLVEPRNSKALVEPLKVLILDATLRKQMGEKARQRVERMFNRKDLIKAVVENRIKLITNKRARD